MAPTPSTIFTSHTRYNFLLAFSIMCPTIRTFLSTLGISVASRLQLVVNVSRKSGFETVRASFLFALFTEYERKYARCPSLAQYISAFIRNGTRVAGTVNLLYRHWDVISYHDRKLASLILPFHGMLWLPHFASIMFYREESNKDHSPALEKKFRTFSIVRFQSTCD